MSLKCKHCGRDIINYPSSTGFVHDNVNKMRFLFCDSLRGLKEEYNADDKAEPEDKEEIILKVLKQFES